MPTETVMTAGEAAQRLAALDTQYAELQNAAVGRGLNPIVSPELADTIAAAFTAYHQWRDALGGITAVWSYGDELNNWTRRANALRAAIVAEGKPAPPALDEWTQTGVSTLLGGVGFGVAAVATLWMLMNRRR